MESSEKKMYLRFVAMILTSILVMFLLTYANTYEWSHVRWSETRFYMVFYMGAAMALVMLGFMLSMMKNTRLNAVIVVVSVIVFGVSLGLVRSQTTVQDRSWMSAMIPHHSIAILTSENAEIDDVRACELSVSIIEAQKREIAEMEWLLDDIADNGPAITAEDATARPVPEFPATSIRSCP
ncbi:MAG: DUF305 domain-containing protein [Acidimicrobiales bacterium]